MVVVVVVVKIDGGCDHLRRPLPTGPGPYQGMHWSQ